MIRGQDLWNDTLLQEMEYREFHGYQVFTYKNMDQSFYHMLKNTAAKYENKIAFCDNWERSYTYGEFLVLVDGMAAWLTANCGIKKGDHVGLLLHNSIEFCAAFYAAARLGAVAVPFPSKYREPEIGALIGKADLNLLIYHEQFEEWVRHYPLDGIGLVRSEDEEHGYGFRHLDMGGLSQGEPAGRLNDPVIIMFTSGTTSQSKGVVLHNYNTVHAVMVYQRLLGIDPEDKTIIPVPIYHITGLVALLGLFVYTGGTVYLYRRYDAERILKCVKTNRITFMHGSPTVFGKLLDFKEEYKKLPSLRILACGSSYMPVEKMKEFHKWLPNLTFQIIYGMTETSSPALIFPYDAPTSIYAGAAGKPIPGMEFKFLGEDGRELGVNEVGEIWIRGSVVMEYYYNLKTDLISGDHWLNTGDMGYYNEDGYVYIVDRKKDMINRGGEKIWCTDVEEEIHRIPGVKDAAVVGIPDEVYGESAAAAVVLEPGVSMTGGEIRTNLEKRIARYKIPVEIIFLEEIPKTPGMKTDKRLIREMFKQPETKQ